MKLLFLGSGSAFTVGANNYQSNMLLMDERGRKLLIDCGSDIRFSLHDRGYSYQDITDIYISHLHADHVGGMEFIGLATLFDPRCPKPNLYASKDVMAELWDRCLAGGMQSIGNDLADLDTFFNVHKIRRNSYFVWNDIQFFLVRVLHIDNGYALMPSYGLFFTLGDKKVFLTTDTQIALDTTQEYYENADIIFHDCETSRFPTSVHAHYQELAKLPERWKNKMWLYGYQPGVLPDARGEGFLGFVQRGQIFEFYDRGVRDAIGSAVEREGKLI
ncbi:MAG: MBL fold metallo-hydrolase [Cyanobacteria bacterium P01_E01_bin.42]